MRRQQSMADCFSSRLNRSEAETEACRFSSGKLKPRKRAKSSFTAPIRWLNERCPACLLKSSVTIQLTNTCTSAALQKQD
mmetsp:Transcript_16336/g.23736  ORF Transcript_16336/g.23736 Transcript_16336/m.23736 type:complete len:80 (-) Transcript_16336:3339-3578(-)